MAESLAQIGYGTLIKRETAAGSGIFVTVAEVTNITALPSVETDEVEVTHMESPDAFREYIAGVKTPGTLDFEINYLVNNASHNTASGLRGLQLAGTKLLWQVVFPQFDPDVTFQGKGFVKTFNPQAPVDGKISATVSVKTSGSWQEI